MYGAIHVIRHVVFNIIKKKKKLKAYLSISECIISDKSCKNL